MVVWYDPDTGKIEFSMTDDALADRANLTDLWQSPKANRLVKKRITEVPKHPIRNYYIAANGALRLLPKSKRPKGGGRQVVLINSGRQ